MIKLGEIGSTMSVGTWESFLFRCLCECQGGGPHEIYRRKSRVTIILDTAASHRQIELAEHSYG